MRDIGWGTAGLLLFGAGVAAIALQNLLVPRHHMHSNDTAALATLRNLASVQGEFRSERLCDLDGDGNGEYGTFGELTGAAGIRGDAGGAKRGAPLLPPILSPALARVDGEGVVTKAGYAFRVFLPGPRGGAVMEGCSAPSSPFSGPVDTDAAEVRWCAYAWPVAHRNSGNRAFFVDQEGDVWKTDNADGRYSGQRSGPAWDAAMPAGGTTGWSTAPNRPEYRGRDGNLWRRTN